MQRFENAASQIDARNALTAEHKGWLQLGCTEVIVDLGQPSNLLGVQPPGGLLQPNSGAISDRWRDLKKPVAPVRTRTRGLSEKRRCASGTRRFRRYTQFPT